MRIYMYAGELRSGFGAGRLQKFFRDFRERTVRERLAARQLPDNLLEPFRVEEQNVAPPEKVSGTVLGGLIPYFVIVLCLTGAMYPAMDLTAGEKERGTMETILCSPVSRVHLVLGKFLMVLTASLFSALLSMISMGVTFEAGRGLLQTLEQFGGSAFPLQISIRAMAAVFLMVVPLAVLFSAALLAIALFAKSYKEAQSYLSPSDHNHRPPGDCFRPARRRAERRALSHSRAQYQPGQQGDRRRHLSLGLHRSDLRLFLRLCLGRSGCGHLALPARRSPLPHLSFRPASASRN